MAATSKLILGECQRTLDERYRLSIPTEMSDLLTAGETSACFLVKEQPGCLSLWNADEWKKKKEGRIEIIERKIQMHLLEGRTGDIQKLGRLLSTRDKEIQMAGRGRLVLPDGFRQFLGVEAGGEVMVVGAGVCVELWNPTRWTDYLEKEIPEFQQLFDGLSS